MTSVSFFKTSNRSLCLDLALLFKTFRLPSISSITDNDNRKLPNASETEATTKHPIHKAAMDSKIKAAVYPMGLFVWNGKLECERKKNDEN